MLRVIGYRDPRPEGYAVIETTSRAGGWSRGLSPFFVGPVTLWGGHVAVNVENAWQYSKVYPQHLDPDTNEPNALWLPWAKAGWAKTHADRYPMGKGGPRPVFSRWGDEQLDYITARKRIYLPLYGSAVVKTDAWRRLKELYDSGVDIALLDFDGYDHKSLGMSYEDVWNCTTRKAGHAFVLAAMLEGEYIPPTEEDVVVDEQDYPVALVIYGSRNFTDYEKMCSILERTSLYKKGIDVIISGAAAGADSLGERFALEHGIPVDQYPAPWEDLEGVDPRHIRTRGDGTKYNVLAGYERNETMAEVATHGAAFWDGHSSGTKDMNIRLATHNVPYIVYNAATDRIDITRRREED